MPVRFELTLRRESKRAGGGGVGRDRGDLSAAASSRLKVQEGAEGQGGKWKEATKNAGTRLPGQKEGRQKMAQSGLAQTTQFRRATVSVCTLYVLYVQSRR